MKKRNVLAIFPALVLGLALMLPVMAYGDDPLVQKEENSPQSSSRYSMPEYFTPITITISSELSGTTAEAIDPMASRLKQQGWRILPGDVLRSSMTFENDTNEYFLLTSPLTVGAYASNTGYTPEQIKDQLYEKGFFFAFQLEHSSEGEIASMPSTAIAKMENAQYYPNGSVFAEMLFGKPYYLMKPGESVTVNWEFAMPVTVGNVFNGASYDFLYQLDAEQAGRVVTHYVEEDGTPLADSSLLYGPLAQPFTVQPQDIEGYTLLRAEGDTTGMFSTTLQEVSFIYARTSQGGGGGGTHAFDTERTSSNILAPTGDSALLGMAAFGALMAGTVVGVATVRGVRDRPVRRPVR